MNIDVDSHFTPPEIYDNAPGRLKDVPKMRFVDGKAQLLCQNGEVLGFSKYNFSVQSRIDAMKEAGFDLQCIGMPMQPLGREWISPETEAYLVRAWNDAVSKLIDEHDCFVGYAQVSHKDPEAATEEARRAVKDLGFSAISIEGVWSGKNIESPEWWPFFEEVERLGVPLMCHSSSISSYTGFSYSVPAHEQLRKFDRIVGAFMALPVTYIISMTGLIFSGLLDEYPGLRFAWLESDVGWIPGFMNLLDGVADTSRVIAASTEQQKVFGESHYVRLKKKPSQYVRDQFYYSINFGTDLELKRLLPIAISKEVGLGKNVMIESDFDHEEGSLDIVRRVRQLDEIDEEAKERICGKNAAELLKVKWAPSTYASLY